VGRRKKNFDNMAAGFDAGTFDRMDRVLAVAKVENRKEFLRQAVEEKLQREERKLQKRKLDSDPQK
jgi:metal-responsive CopG/Arc/MetJ family transcriptional regulator